MFFLQDSDGLNLRNYQLKAIEAVEQALAKGKKTALLSMATGTGKTRTILGMIYRFLKVRDLKEFCFLLIELLLESKLKMYSKM